MIILHIPSNNIYLYNLFPFKQNKIIKSKQSSLDTSLNLFKYTLN